VTLTQSGGNLREKGPGLKNKKKRGEKERTGGKKPSNEGVTVYALRSIVPTIEIVQSVLSCSPEVAWGGEGNI